MTESECRVILNELPPPIAERAQRNFDAVFFDRFSHSSYVTPLKAAVYNSFRWSTTTEGESFWMSVAQAAAGNYNYPKLT